ncbi:hypothetical protein B0J13DRAFT_547223, partial [Dactylonectria estremocensis]
MTSPVLLSTTQHDSNSMEIDNPAMDLLADELAKFSVTRRDLDRNIRQHSRFCVERSTRRGPKRRSSRPRRSPINHGRYSNPSCPKQKTAASSHDEAARDAFHRDHAPTCQGAGMEAGEAAGEPLIPIHYLDLTDDRKSLETILSESVVIYVEASSCQDL